MTGCFNNAFFHIKCFRKLTLTVDKINVYHTELRVSVLGPGIRRAIWVQGCSIHCPFCLVKDSWNPKLGQKVKIEFLVDEIVAQHDIEGITITGGEPIDQASGLAMFLEILGQKRPDLSVMIFSGYVYETLVKREDRYINTVLAHCDILVDGPFLINQRCNDAWRGSANQRIFYLTNRYSAKDYIKAQGGGVEVYLRPTGMFVVGVPNIGVVETLEKQLASEGILFKK